MGVDTRKPALPAPTDSSTFETSGASATGTDLATDVSRRTDKSSYEIPDDGRPITIPTRKKGDKAGGKLSRSHQQSQTSLLIEYFEGGKEGANTQTRRPSVRVKVTPSTAKKLKDQNDHIVVSETNGTRRPSYSRRISLGPPGSPKQITDNQSISSITSLAEDSNLVGRAPPVEIEVLNKGQGSDLSGASESREARYIVPPSDISSMPPDSMLEGNPPATEIKHQRSRSVSREELALGKDTLKAPSRRRSRSLSRERITQKVIEKLGNKPTEVTTGGKRKHSEKSRSRSVSKEILNAETIKSPRRRSGKHREDESVTTAESSLLSNPLDPRRHSTDQYSFRSGTSKSSINNPKLLETVEDAIRRLILPELKELKKDQKGQPRRNKAIDPSDISTSSMSREDVTRRVSKRASSPDVKKPKVIRRDSRESEELLSSGSRRRRRRHRDTDSPSDRSYRRRESGDSTIIEDEKPHHKRKDHRVRDAAAGALLGGALTAAALKHHNSKPEIDTRERRKKRSKSRSSRSTSVPEAEEIFEKHDVAPMPMRSDIDSELTRTSLLSDQTTSTASPTHREVREVTRGSPREVLSPGSATPTRSPRTPLTPVNLQQGLGTRHGNLSTGDLSIHKSTSDHSVHNVKSHGLGDAALAGAVGAGAVLAGEHLTDFERQRRYEKNLHTTHPIRQGLSPIQSVASVRDSVQDTVSEPPRESVYYSRSTGSLSSLGKEKSVQEHRASYESLSTAPSPIIARSKRPQGINLEKPGDVLGQYDLPQDSQSYSDSATEKDVDAWYDEQHRENDKYRESMVSDDQYRESFASSDPRIDVRHLTNYTDDSLDSPCIDKVTAGQQVARGSGANPEYVHTPVAVESAVASLYDPSIIDVHSSQSPNRSYTGSAGHQIPDSPRSLAQSAKDQLSSGRGSPLKQEYLPPSQVEETSKSRAMVSSPPQSVAESIEEPQMGTSGVPNAEDPMPEIGHIHDSAESDITTNPSVIQGPIGGVSHENRDHWPYNPTPDRVKENDLSPKNDQPGLGPGKAAMLGAGLGMGLGAIAKHGDKEEEDIPLGYGGHYGQFSPGGDSHAENRNAQLSPGLKDEGYISAANPKSPGSLTPDITRKPVGSGAVRGANLVEDPFLGDGRPVSGYSQGMGSPLYDSATGKGIDRIQSKDIVALMDHLTVRDAHRNARDTEILVTLVRSAAEMRNSFEDMKRFIAEQNDLNMDTSDRQHEKTAQKIIGGPRPQPHRPLRKLSTDDEEDLPTKRRNVFRRALRGLGSKNNAELQNIEGMLVQLLGEVEGLRADHERRPVISRSQQGSYNSADQLRETVEEGYEPEGQAGTSSTGNRSGFLSTNSSRQMGESRGYGIGRKESENRISTVLEGDEDLEHPESHQQEILDRQPTHEVELDSPQDFRDSREDARGHTVPFSPQEKSTSAPQSSENTPRMSDNGKGRKHKSSSSSFFPKISRWSKTTASSVGDTFRSSVQNSARKERPLSDASKSGSDLGRYEYDPTGDDRLHSNDSFNVQQENRPPSPLIPSQVSDNPKYQAHRNSLNLQHPQPRQGPTGRYQNHLENEAQNYMLSPTSPSSDRWEGELPGLLPMSDNTNKSHSSARHSYGANPGHLSPISDGGYSETSSAMMELGEKEASRTSLNAPPPRPPKIKDDGPLVPDRPPKLAMSPANAGRNPTYADHVAAARAGSPAYHSGSPPTVRSASGQTPPSRKPGGPRPITTSGQYSPGNINAVKRNRYRGSPNHVERSSSEDLDY